MHSVQNSSPSTTSLQGSASKLFSIHKLNVLTTQTVALHRETSLDSIHVAVTVVIRLGTSSTDVHYVLV